MTIKRIIYRGRAYTFKQSFLDSNGDPLVVKDATYPRYSIYDLDSNEIETGTAFETADPGWYGVRFQSRDDAPLSTDESGWRIEWLFIDEDDVYYHKIEDFDLADETISAAEEISQQFIFLASKENRLTLRLFTDPFSILLTIYDSAGTATSIEAIEYPGIDIDKITDGDSFVFAYKLAKNILTEGNNYSAMWEVLELPDSTPDYIWQKIVAVHWRVLNMIPNLRMLIDKIQKKYGTVQSYTDADLTNYIEQGLSMLNGWFPLSEYSYTTLPNTLSIFHLLMSACYGLNAQFMLELDSAFSFSGQAVTLDYDRTGGIESTITRLMDYVTNNLSKAKTAIIRSTSLGTVAVRPYRGTQPVSRGYFGGSGVPNTVVDQLASILNWF